MRSGRVGARWKINRQHRDLTLKIVSLVPSITELLFDLGLADQIVGRTKFCIEPGDQVKNVSIVGGTKNFHVDRIQKLDPDLIIANKEENDRERIEALIPDYPVHVTEVKTLKDALEMIVDVGKLTGVTSTAQQLVTAISSHFHDLVTEQPSILAAYVIWNDPIMVAGGDTFISDMMERAHFNNVYQDHERYPEVTPEELHASGCELLLLSSEPFPFKEKHLIDYQERFPPIRPILVDGKYFSWYGSRLMKAPEYFKQLQAL